MWKLLASPVWFAVLIFDLLFFMSLSAAPELSPYRRIADRWIMPGIVIGLVCVPAMFYRVRMARWRKSGERGLLISDMVLAGGGIIVLLGFMMDRAAAIRVETAGPLGPISYCRGVEVWRSGFRAQGQSRLTRIDEWHGFYRVAGIQQSRSFAIYLTPSWMFLALNVPFALWLVLSIVRYRRFLVRLESGCCPHCGYDLTDNQTGVCPECGAKINLDPLIVNVAGIQVKESVDVVNGNQEYGLILAARISTDAPIRLQMRRINEVLLQWIRRRGNSARTVTMEFTMTPDCEHEITDLAFRLLNQDIPEADILRTLGARVVLKDEFGKPFKRFGL